jgi:hypothetical protein
MNSRLMYHMIGVASVLLFQYVFIYYTIGFYYTFYSKYEIDLENRDEKIKFTNNDIKKGVEYSMLMNEEDEL